MGELVVMRSSDAGLKDLVKLLLDNSVIAEIGSYAGESAEIFLNSGKIRKIFCIDPWKDNYDRVHKLAYQCEMEKVEKAFDKRMKKFGNKFIKIKSSSEEVVKEFKDGTFDMVYIDGNHFYEYVRKDIELWLPKIRIGGYIAGHDYQVKEIVNAVKDTIGKPEIIFEDFSWCKQITL